MTSSVLEDVGVGTVDRDVMLDSRLPAMTKLVYALMTCYSDEERCVSVTRGLLAHHLNVSRATIDKAVTAGKAVGLWDVLKQEYDDGGKAYNLYVLNDLGAGFEAHIEGLPMPWDNLPAVSYSLVDVRPHPVEPVMRRAERVKI